jgi:hypothetical protein
MTRKGATLAKQTRKDEHQKRRQELKRDVRLSPSHLLRRSHLQRACSYDDSVVDCEPDNAVASARCQWAHAPTLDDSLYPRLHPGILL